MYKETNKLNLLITKNKFPNQFKGIQLGVSGRLRGVQRTRKLLVNQGRISTQTIKSSLQTNKKQIFTKWGTFGSTVSISRSS